MAIYVRVVFAFTDTSSLIYGLFKFYLQILNYSGVSRRSIKSCGSNACGVNRFDLLRLRWEAKKKWSIGETSLRWTMYRVE